MNSQISFEQAREIAKSAAANDVKGIQVDDSKNLLDVDYLEAEYCWIFFRNKEIQIPSEQWFVAAYGAYAVSKKGAFSQITDFGRDPKELEVYLQVMSDYFKKKNL
ncbi:hypothetical protein [Paraburkholderia sediminicola]|uniref:hypothetical protein n=1 Tax=Paraburkholderia sediminicola TaxID=458836 RepID=UPI0038BD93F5